MYVHMYVDNNFRDLDWQWHVSEIKRETCYLYCTSYSYFHLLHCSISVFTYMLYSAIQPFKGCKSVQ